MQQTSENAKLIKIRQYKWSTLEERLSMFCFTEYTVLCGVYAMVGTFPVSCILSSLSFLTTVGLYREPWENVMGFT